MLKQIIIFHILIFSSIVLFSQSSLVSEKLPGWNNKRKNGDIQDTIIQIIKITNHSDSTLKVELNAMHYDSLGASFSYGITCSGYINASVHPIPFEQLKKHESEYEFYHCDSECYIGIGLSKVDPNYAILITGECFKLLFVSERKIKIEK